MVKTKYLLPAVLLAALLLRLPGCFNDFWLDEVWTWYITAQLDSPLEILTEFKHSNNHPLNTLIYYLLGDQQQWFWYRLPSLAAGVASVLLGWLILRNENKCAAFCAALLMSTSYPMIHFSSEARGYALVICFGLSSFFALKSFVRQRRRRWAIAFWISVILGFLSHPMYLHVFVASAVWLIVHLFQTLKNNREIISAYLQCFFVPIIFCVFFYLFFIRPMTIGGGPPYRLIDVLTLTLSLAGGGPADGPAMALIGLLTACLFLAVVIWMRRNGRPDWLFYLIVIFLSPAALLTFTPPKVLFVRYFLLSMAFGYLALGCFLADFYRRAGWTKFTVATILILSLLGHALNLFQFLRYGRGQYLQGLHFIADQTQASVITLASDHDFRNAMMVNFYQRYLPGDKKIAYFNQARLPVRGTQWFIAHRLGPMAALPGLITDHFGNPYRLVKTFPYSAMLSGFHWFIYQQQSSNYPNHSPAVP